MISLFIITFIWRGLIARQQKEVFRSKVRMIRDDLFDFMWKNGYDFTEPAYCDMRQTLNGMIRLSNILGPFEFIAITVRFRDYQASTSTRSSFESLEDSPLKSKLEKVFNEAQVEWLKFLFLTGISGLFLRSIFLVFGTIGYVIRLKQSFRDKTKSFLDQAYEFGAPQLSQSQRSTLLR